MPFLPSPRVPCPAALWCRSETLGTVAALTGILGAQRAWVPRPILWLPKDLASTWPGLTPGPRTVGYAAFWGGLICARTTRNKEGVSFTHTGDVHIGGHGS